jgi:hypothetical protein
MMDKDKDNKEEEEEEKTPQQNKDLRLTHSLTPITLISQSLLCII